MERIIFHIDVNSAFLSWTAVQLLAQGSTLDIRTVPSVVSGDPSDRRSTVTAKSIPAKEYGINTAEPVSMAMRKCNGQSFARNPLPDGTDCFEVKDREGKVIEQHLVVKSLI